MDRAGEKNRSEGDAGTGKSGRCTLLFTVVFCLMAAALIVLAYLAVCWNFGAKESGAAPVARTVNHFAAQPYSIMIHQPDAEKESYQAAYDLFDKHFSQLLTVLGILITVFGLGIPAIAYCLQRQSLKEEKEMVKREFALKLKEFQRELRKEIKSVADAVRGEISEKCDELEKNIGGINEKIHSDVDDAITGLRKQLTEKVEESINAIDAKVNDVNGKILGAKAESLEKFVKLDEGLSAKIAGITSKIDEHDKKMAIHDDKLRQRKLEQDFSFGYFAQQLGTLYWNDNKHSSASHYFIVAASELSETTEKERAKRCMRKVVDALKKITDKSLSGGFFDGFNHNLRAFEKNMKSDEKAMTLLEEVRAEIRRVEQDKPADDGKAGEK